jgi:hypothetical protein
MPEMKVNPEVRLTTISPQFVVPDVMAAEYYRDVPGFRILGYFLDPPIFAMVARDTVEIHFGKPAMVCFLPRTPNVAGVASVSTLISG